MSSPPRWRRFVSSVVLAILVAGCGPAAATFSPRGPCVADGRSPGAYPDLEALVPKTFEARPPDRLDSGRNCTVANLASLASHGLTEVRFAGGLWQTGNQSGVTLAVFRAAAPAATVLTRDWLFEFYETGARTARSTDRIETSDVTVGGAAGRRLDTLNDESYQTVIVWPGPEAGTIDVVLVGSDVREVKTRDAHEAFVRAGLAAFTAGG